jgi:hypothetical protein
MSLMEKFHGLFEADGDEQADNDCRDMDEEAFPGVYRLVGHGHRP